MVHKCFDKRVLSTLPAHRNRNWHASLKHSQFIGSNLSQHHDALNVANNRVVCYRPCVLILTHFQ